MGYHTSPSRDNSYASFTQNPPNLLGNLLRPGLILCARCEPKIRHHMTKHLVLHTFQFPGVNNLSLNIFPSLLLGFGHESINHAWSKIRAEDTGIRMLAFDERGDDSCSACVVKDVRRTSNWERDKERIHESELGDGEG